MPDCQAKLAEEVRFYGILTIMVHFLKSDSRPLGICAETANLCLPGPNRNDSVLPEMPLTSPVAPAGTGIEPIFSAFAIPLEIS